MRYDARDDELDTMDVAELCLLLRQYRDEARKLKLAQGNARCHENEREFFRIVLPEGDEGMMPPDDSGPSA
jgi:hypothetical protein